MEARKRESFPCIMLSRADFEDLGYSTGKVTDEQMEYVARKIGDALMDGGDYWESIEFWAEQMGCPKS